MKMTAAGRLVFGTMLLAVIGVGSGVVALAVNRYLGSLLEQAVTVGAERQALAGKVSAGAAELMALDRGLAFAMVLQQTQEANQMQGKLEAASSQLDQVIERYSAIAAEGVRGELNALKEQQRDVAKLQGEVVSGLNQQRMDQALEVLNTSLLPRLESMGRTAKQLVAREQEALSRHEAESQSARSWSLYSLAGLILVASAVSVLVVQWIVAMMRNLRRVLGELNGQANQVNKMSAEISESAEALSRNASEQAASLDETSASSEEIHVMTRRSAENAKDAASQMGEASGLIEEANDALRRMVASMNEISSSSGKISKIIRVIDEIAFQTNILALNAAVEAARAGEAGMGFAVVADEVRSLAQRSAQAASDTTQLIEESIRSASEGKRKLDEVARAIAAVTDRAKSAKGLVDHVHVASEEQERGIEQIAKSVARMGEVTQQVASTAEQSASAGRLLREQASSVDSMVASLRGMVGEEVHA